MLTKQTTDEKYAPVQDEGAGYRWLSRHSRGVRWPDWVKSVEYRVEGNKHIFVCRQRVIALETIDNFFTGLFDPRIGGRETYSTALEYGRNHGQPVLYIVVTVGER